MKLSLPNIFLIFFTLLAISGCDLDDIVESPPRLLNITEGPAENEIVKTSSVFFSWEGAYEEQVFEYRLLKRDRNDFFEEFYGWSGQTIYTSVNLSGLDEGIYRFEIKTYKDGIEDIRQRLFTIDAVQAPAIYFSGKSISFQTGSGADIFIAADFIAGVSGVNFALLYDESYLSLNEITVVDESAFGGAYILYEENITGYIYEYPEYKNGIKYEFTFAGEIKEYNAVLLKLNVNLKKKGKTSLQIYNGHVTGGNNSEIPLNYAPPLEIIIAE